MPLVGTGRFAGALGIEHGVDPSLPALDLARAKGIDAREGSGEHIPFEDSSFGGVLMALTLCFVADPDVVLREVRRVLLPGGGFVLGLLLKGTPWADSYAGRGQAGHPIYRHARFHTLSEVETLLSEGGFRAVQYRSTLFQAPGLDTYEPETPVEGFAEGAGFIGLAAEKTPA